MSDPFATLYSNPYRYHTPILIDNHLLDCYNVTCAAKKIGIARRYDLKIDKRKEPFTSMVTIGDSITAGGSATKRENCWAGILASFISKYQKNDVRSFNAGMGGNVISNKCPRYSEARKPSGLERCKRDIIEKRPDLVIVAYSTNEMFFGMAPEIYAIELDQIVKEIKAGTDALIVLLGPYFMPDNTVPDSPYNQGGYATACRYNKVTEDCAAENDVLFVDVFSEIGQAPWVVDIDNVHLNDVGHMAVACRIFDTIALNCSCLSVRSYEDAVIRPAWRDETHLMSYEGM
jgi:lysophospholipase L1-like esterase